MPVAGTFMEWNGAALVPLTIREAGDRAVRATNANTNPSAAANATGYGFVNGTGGQGSVAWNSGPGADNKPGFVRATWTTASTSGGGINLNTTTMIRDVVAIGDVRTIQAMIRLPQARVVSFGGYIRSGSTGSSGGGAKFSIPANTWSPMLVTLPPSPINGDNIYLYSYFDGAANAPGAGFTMDLDLIMAGPNETYFDGDTTDTMEDAYEWLGVPHQSASVRRDPRGGTLTAIIV